MGNSPLLAACEYDIDFEKVKFLVNMKAEMNVKNKESITPLLASVLNNQKKECLDFLISSKADINCRFENGDTFFHILSKKMNVQLISYFYEKGFLFIYLFLFICFLFFIFVYLYFYFFIFYFLFLFFIFFYFLFFIFFSQRIES